MYIQNHSNLTGEISASSSYLSQWIRKSYHRINPNPQQESGIAAVLLVGWGRVRHCAEDWLPGDYGSARSQPCQKNCILLPFYTPASYGNFWNRVEHYEAGVPNLPLRGCQKPRAAAWRRYKVRIHPRGSTVVQAQYLQNAGDSKGLDSQVLVCRLPLSSRRVK